jgi:hypothetical protein
MESESGLVRPRTNLANTVEHSAVGHGVLFGPRRSEGSLEVGGERGLRTGVRQRFEHAAGAVGAIRQKHRNGLSQGVESIVIVAGVAVNAVQECGEIDEFVTGIDELEVEQFLLGWHAQSLRGDLKIPIAKRMKVHFA